MIKKITVIGAGNGGCSMAADFSLAGYKVNLYEFPEFSSKIATIKEKGEIEIKSKTRQGLARLNLVTTNIDEAVEGADIILVVTVSNGHKKVAELMAPFIKKEQLIVLVPGSTGGALEFSKVLREKGFTEEIKIAETNTLPYATRIIGPNSVMVKHLLKWILFACFPAKYTNDTLSVFQELFPAAVAANDVLETSLNNGNPVTHSAATILNAGRIEHSKGEFYLYKEAITPSVSRVIEAVDNERLSLCRALGYPEYSSLYRLYKSGYSKTNASLYEAYTTSDVFCGEWSSKGPSSLTARYITEDVGYGMVFWISLAKMLKVEVPTMKAILLMSSLLNNTDYETLCTRTMEKLGLAGLNAEEIKDYLKSGVMPK